jgi:hypothetical protein
MDGAAQSRGERERNGQSVGHADHEIFERLRHQEMLFFVVIMIIRRL